ncbi:MAG: acetyl-CoA C-acetyltransferase [Actinomycetota bacterium]|nr:acetyl-CoA C-acetyltransferase [Actinomycetota bacterium]
MWGVQLDPRLPVIVGVGQTSSKPSAWADDLPSPPSLMAAALELAAIDSGAGERLLKAADSLQTVEAMSWRAPDPAGFVASLLGLSPRERVRTTTGGNSPQTLVNQAASAIASGSLDVVLITGAEAMYSRRLAAKAGVDTGWPKQDESAVPSRVVGVAADQPGTSEFEMKRSLVVPTQVYPVFECALRAEAGASVEEHQVRVSELWSRFSSVASTNPYAWSPSPLTAEEIRTVGPDNRMIGFPYPKLMNSNIQVDQAAALIVCSVEAARSAGVPEDRWVFVHSGADAHDHWFPSNRWSLGRSPAIAACGDLGLALAGIGVDDIAHLDLYSCFPSAVEVAALELGIDAWDPSRVPTVTGGLCFAGGPGNNYVTHSIASMVDRLRSDAGSYGLVTANGWYLTKHALGIYSTTPPAAGFRWASGQDTVHASPSRDVAVDYSGPAVIEAYTVLHDRDGSPNLGIVACLLADGRRTWANTTDPSCLHALTTEACEHRAVTIDRLGALTSE